MEPHEVPTPHPQLINRAACCSSSPHKGPAHRLRFRYTPRMDAGNDKLWMTELECELSSVSLRGVRCGCSPAPTNASRDVANSILAMLRGWGAGDDARLGWDSSVICGTGVCGEGRVAAGSSHCPPDGSQGQVQNHGVAGQVPHPDAAPVSNGQTAGGGREVVAERRVSKGTAQARRRRQLRQQQTAPPRQHPAASGLPAVLVEGQEQLTRCSAVCSQSHSGCSPESSSHAVR